MFKAELKISSISTLSDASTAQLKTEGLYLYENNFTT